MCISSFTGCLHFVQTVTSHALRRQFMGVGEGKIGDFILEKKEHKALVAVQVLLPLQQKQKLERRAQAQGVSVSALLRGMITNPKRSTEEILAREWVSVALQLRSLQSEGLETLELYGILEQLKLLIQRTTSKIRTGSQDL